jgi:transcriptional regulator with XRE-family HTH domain
MQEDILIQISNKLKEKRRERGITLQTLADQAQVSKGLISQIENNRTIPSLLVLINLIKSLGVDLNDFFNEIGPNGTPEAVVIRRQADYQPFEKENARGFRYRRILTRTVHGQAIDVVLLNLTPQARRAAFVKTDAYELKYVLSGRIEYVIGDHTYALEEGDSLFFDGRVPHNLRNTGETEAVLLVIYFFHEKK